MGKETSCKGILVDTASGPDGPALYLDEWRDRTYTRKRKVLASGQLKLTRYRFRACVGYYDFRTLDMYPCPEHSSLNNREVRCSECHRRSLYITAFEKVSENQLNGRMREYIRQPHSVYFAWFGAHSLKVGISKSDRLLLRLYEQGAIYALEIASLSDGYSARELENQLSEQLTIPQSVSSKKKRTGLRDLSNIEHGRRELYLALQAAVGNGFPVSSIRHIDCRDCYGSIEPITSFNDIDHVTPIQLNGRFIGCYGRNLALYNNNQTDIINIRKLQSHMISLEYIT